MSFKYAIRVLNKKVNEIEYTLGCIGEVAYEDFEKIQTKKQELIQAIEQLTLLDNVYGITPLKNE